MTLTLTLVLLVIALVLAAIDIFQSRGRALTSWAAALIATALLLAQ